MRADEVDHLRQACGAQRLEVECSERAGIVDSVRSGAVDDPERVGQHRAVTAR
jgi:hypothetical protein